jgi:hypothetical protein
LLPRRRRWWVVVALFAALAFSARHAAGAHAQFIGLTLPLGLWLASTIMAMLYSAPSAPPAPESTPPHPEPKPSSAREPTDSAKKKTKPSKKRRKS